DGDVQANARLTIMGRAQPVSDEELPDARARYLARLPSAESYSSTHDFSFYAISLVHVRFIGGFGSIHWLPAEKLTLAPTEDPLHADAPGIVEHMNADHGDALQLYCRAF